jgi:membrane protein YdbS with pleckstrin-like domain
MSEVIALICWPRAGREGRLNDQTDNGRAPRQSVGDVPGPRSDAARSAGGADRDGASVADGRDHPVDPAWVTATRISSAIAAAMFAVPLVIGAVIGSFLASDVPAMVRVGGFAGVAIVLVALGWSVIALPVLRHRRLRYRLDGQGLGIRRGVWWRSESWVPRSRIQHTDVTQGPVERAFGLATLVLFTAGTEHARVTLEGLREQRARTIRDHLVDRGHDDGV